MPRTLALAAALMVIVVSGPRASHGATNATVTLQWTSPGDDSLIGIATQYQLRYSTALITEANFGSGVLVSNVPAPAAAGTAQSCSVSGLTTGTKYYFAIRTRDEVSNWSRISNVASKTPGSTVGVGDGVVALEFSKPYPNPSRHSATFAIGLPQESEALVEAFDVMGRQIRTLASGRRPAGNTTLVWDLRDDRGIQLGPGVYLVRAVFGGTSFTRRVIVSR